MPFSKLLDKLTFDSTDLLALGSKGAFDILDDVLKGKCSIFHVVVVTASSLKSDLIEFICTKRFRLHDDLLLFQVSCRTFDVFEDPIEHLCVELSAFIKGTCSPIGDL